jgi:DNA-binding transcriptional regulator YiaG
VASADLITDAVKVGLQYLAVETRYRPSSLPSTSLPFEDVPRIRELAARLAGSLARRVGTEDETVRIWEKEMAEEPLAQVRLAMVEAGMGTVGSLIVPQLPAAL